MIDIAAELGADVDADSAARYKPRYNIAPTDPHWLLVADDDGKRHVVPAVWGIPSEKKPIINVRGEAVRKGSFKSRKHALAIVDGYFEWLVDGKLRRPFWYHDPSGRLLLFAALDTPLTSSAKAPTAFSIITVAANKDAAAVHNRMPAIIPLDHADAWLRSPALELLVPATDGALAAVEVSTRVNRVANDDSACLVPAPAAPPRPRQMPLFDKT
jgi:putative SOS response-associated peptidase YedK